MLNKSGESGHSCPVSDLIGKAFNLSTFSMLLVVGMPYVTFIMLRYLLSSLDLLKVFGMNRCWIWSNDVSASLEMSMWFFNFVNMVYHFDWFGYVEPALQPRDKSHLIMANDSFNVLLNSVYQYFIISIFIRDIDLYSSLPVVFFSGFGIRIMVASRNEFESVSFYLIFLKKNLRIIGLKNNLND